MPIIVKFRQTFREFCKFSVLSLVAGSLVSCDTPQRRGLRELSKRGISPSGKALLEAVIDRDSKRVSWLIDVGVYTEQCAPDGKTPIRIALENEDLGSVYRLLDSKANVNATTPDHVSLLGVAVERGETAIVEKLLKVGARTDGLMPDGEKILPWAISKGRLTFVRAMMQSGADPHLKDSKGSPLLHVAMEANRRDLMEALIVLGADPGATNAGGETTLQLAFNNGWLDAVPKLAAAGADPNISGKDGRTLLDRAVSDGNVENISLLLRVGADPNRLEETGHGSTLLERTFDSSDPKIFRVLLDHGVKPSAQTWDRWLWKKFGKRDLEGAQMLLAHGARATSRDAAGRTLVEAAALAQEGSFVKLLTDYGDPVGDALYQSVVLGNYDMTSLLVSCGASVDAIPMPSLDTPFTLAIRKKQDRIAEFLIQSGATTDLRLPEGQTPFHLAVATGCHRTVKLLLDEGVDPNTPFKIPVSPDFLKSVRPGVIRWVLKNDRNVTPLMVAADSGVVETARHLMRAGAKMEVHTRSTSMWPINFASRRNDVRMMRLFLGRDPLREERRIEIRLSEQRARVFDSQGNEIFTTKVSTGKKGHATPTGEYVITNKYRDWTSTLYHASMPYFQRLSCGDFGLHQGNVPDYPASHGCIRVPAGNAQKLFTLTQSGDRVNIIP